MVSKVSRRNFLKGAAAMTVAAAASTLLAGCSGNGGNDVPDPNTITLGDYKVKVTLADKDQSKTETGTGNNAKVVEKIQPTVSISYSGAGFTGLFYNDVFAATMGDKEMKLNNKAGMIVSKDFGNLSGVVSSFVAYKPEFQTDDKDLIAQYNSGKTVMKLKVVLDKETAVFTIKNDCTVTATKL